MRKGHRPMVQHWSPTGPVVCDGCDTPSARRHPRPSTTHIQQTSNFTSFHRVADGKVPNHPRGRPPTKAAPILKQCTTSSKHRYGILPAFPYVINSFTGHYWPRGRDNLEVQPPPGKYLQVLPACHTHTHTHTHTWPTASSTVA